MHNPHEQVSSVLRQACLGISILLKFYYNKVLVCHISSSSYVSISTVLQFNYFKQPNCKYYFSTKPWIVYNSPSEWEISWNIFSDILKVRKNFSLLDRNTYINSAFHWVLNASGRGKALGFFFENAWNIICRAWNFISKIFFHHLLTLRLMQ